MRLFLQKQVGLSQAVANEVVAQLFADLRKQLLKRRVVMLPSIGTFEFTQPRRRYFYNFQTGKVEDQPCQGKLKFTPAEEFRVEFNKRNAGHSAAK